MKKIILLLLVMVFLAGCVTTPKTHHHGLSRFGKREWFYFEGPKITSEQIETIKVAVKEGLIKVGMIKDEVKELFGEPQIRKKGVVLNHPKWEYWEWKYFPKKRFFRVTFQDDKVIKYGWWKEVSSFSGFHIR
jgi:hypothetical protein